MLEIGYIVNSIDNETASIHGIKLEPKIITLKSVFSTGRLFLKPIKDKNLEVYKGVKLLSEKDLKKCSYYINTKNINEHLRIIENGSTLKLFNIKDAIDWMWLQKENTIAISKESIDFNTLFFINKVETIISNDLYLIC